MSIKQVNIKNLHNVSHVFTFCNDSVYSRCYVEIEGEYHISRRVMMRHFGESWGFQYANRDDAGVYKFDLMQINLDGTMVR